MFQAFWKSGDTDQCSVYLVTVGFPFTNYGKAIASTPGTSVFPEVSEGWAACFLGLYLINVHR